MIKTPPHYNSTDVLSVLRKLATPERAKSNQWFFKTQPGQYGYGDKFWGLTVPQTRLVAKQFRELPLSEIEELLRHKIHEVRLCALYLLVARAKQYPEEVFNLYVKNLQSINNWDLVDASAGSIVGNFILVHPNKQKLLDQLIISKNLWERRIAMIATFAFIMKSEFQLTFTMAEKLLNDKEDLLHKASGWMLREVGKRGGEQLLVEFLGKHATKMPRTMLRYAIERFPESERKKWLAVRRTT